MKRAAVLFAGALAVRLLAMVLLRRPDELWPEGLWTWAFEQGRIAEALLAGHGYADVFGEGSGPTAWCGPVYPAFLALVIWLCGGVNTAAATVALLNGSKRPNAPPGNVM